MGRRTRPEPGREYHRQLVEAVLSGKCPEYEWLRDRGIKTWTISKWRLGVVHRPLPGHEKFEGCVTLPYLAPIGRDQWGKTVWEERGLRVRRLDDRKPKYDALFGSGRHLFGVGYSSRSVVYITEGEFDCMILHQMGLKAVGVPGANAWDPRWRWCFRGCDEIVVVSDGDGVEGSKTDLATKGKLFKMKVTMSLKGLPAYVRSVPMPKGYDVNELYLEDREELRRLLRRTA